MSVKTPVPASSDLNIAAFSRLFGNVTNSYKFIFFLSLLDILKRRDFDAAEPISFREMTVEMLANAWYPHSYFRLSFGLQDKITAKLDALKLQVGAPVLKFKDGDKKLLREAIAEHQLDDSLLTYVPFRLLSPFFEAELSRLIDYKINAKVVELAAAYFDDRKPLYRFNANVDGLILHPAWAEYLKTHFAIIKGWTAWHWLEYMQKCNQGVPAVSAKLFPPAGRDSLSKQKAYWQTVLSDSPQTCIYSGLQLDANRISLDHYVPWSFVAHDQLWNLIPTTPEVNSSKSDRLPAAKYFARFVTLQHSGLVVTHQQWAERKWEKAVEPFIADLKISHTPDLLDQTKLHQAYKSTLLPLLELAQTLGFSPNWVYQQMNF